MIAGARAGTFAIRMSQHTSIGTALWFYGGGVGFYY